MAVTKQKSASVSHRHEKLAKDERIRRTRARIDTAFAELLHRRAYGNIRVSDITKKAGVGRATFYAHYATKDELFLSQCRRIVAPMLAPVSGDKGGIDATRFFEHVRTSPNIYRSLFGPEGGSAPSILREFFDQRIRELLKLPASQPRLAGLRGAALSPLIASALFTLVECWLANRARETAAQVQSLFSTLASRALTQLP